MTTAYRPFLVCLCLAITSLFGVQPARCEAQGVATGLTLEMSLAKARVYQGEPVAVSVTLRAEGRKIRNIGYPRFKHQPIDFAAVTPSAGDEATERNVYSFTGELLLTDLGNIRVGPAYLECEIIEPAVGGAAFFGAGTPHQVSLASQPATIEVVPLPETGRPTSFSGAVGSFAMDVTVKPEELAIGDPLSVFLTVRGSGSLVAVGCPAISGPGLRIYPPVVKRTADRLECEQVVIIGDSASLPVVEWAYLDPKAGAYRVERRTLPLRVHARAEPAVAPPASAGQQSKAFPLFVLLGVGLVIAVATGFFSLRSRKTREAAKPPLTEHSPDPWQFSLSPLEQALAEGDVEKFYSVMRVQLQKRVGSLSGVDPATVTNAPSVLPHASSLSQLFAHCDRVRYGHFTPDVKMMQADLDLQRTILRTHC